MKRKVVIMGAAGRDFHDFNTTFRDNESYEVVAFTQTFAQNIGELEEVPERSYPSSLAGDLYPEGIPIVTEDSLEDLVEEKGVDEVVFSYSDVSHEHVMHQASRAISSGAGFRLLGPGDMMLESDRPVIAVDAVRTGTGKSQVSLKIADILGDMGKDVVVVREPMPYGDLEEQAVQRFESREDLDEGEVTIEEREEYEQHIEKGHVVYAGVDYVKILERAEEEADIIVWEGGNNELPFFSPDIHFVVADPHRAGHELRYHPGESNLRMADYVVINKENTAEDGSIEEVAENVKRANPGADIIHVDSVVSVDDEDSIRDRKVLVVEDGPTMTHGGASYGAGTVAAEKFGSGEIVDPRKSAVGSIKKTLEKYSHLEGVLPAMGYSGEQVDELEETINGSEAEVVIVGTPHDLGRLIETDKDVVRVRYEVEERGVTLRDILEENSGLLGL